MVQRPSVPWSPLAGILALQDCCWHPECPHSRRRISPDSVSPSRKWDSWNWVSMKIRGTSCYHSVWLVSGRATGSTWERKAFVSVMLEEEASSSSLSDGASHQFRISGYHLWPINERLLQQKRRKWYSSPRVGYSFKISAFRGLVILLS